MGTGTSQGVPVIGCDCEVCQSKDTRDQRLRSSVQFKFPHAALQIDAGPDFRVQMLREGLSTVDAVLFTHEHQDHIAGLDDVRPMIFRTNKAMRIVGQERVLNRIQKVYDYAFEHQPYPGAPRFELTTIGYEPFEIEGITVQPLPVLHGKLPILGYRIGNTAYLTDVNHIPEATLALMQGLDYLIVDALHHRPHFSHNTLAEAVQMAQNVGATQTYFIHMSHHMGTHEATEATLPEGMSLSYDGLRIPVTI